MAPAALPKAVRFAQDTDLRPYLQAAIVQHSYTVMAEAATVPNHNRRAAYANQVLQNPSAFVDRFAWALTVAGPLVNKWLDQPEQRENSGGAVGDIPSAIATGWDIMSGVTAKAAEDQASPSP